MARDNQIIYDAEQEEKERFDEFVSSLLLGLASVSSIDSFATYRRIAERRIDKYMKGYEGRLKDSIRKGVESISKKLATDEYIDQAFKNIYKIKGTNNTITLKEILERAGYRIKGDLTTETLRTIGFDTPSQNNIASIRKAMLKKNQNSLAQTLGNEMHKAREQAKIDKVVEIDKRGEKEKVFYYNTQNDDNVRTWHAALQGEMTIAEAQEARNTTMSEINCRCYLTEI